MILRRKRLQRSSVPKRGGPLKRGRGVRRVSALRAGVVRADAEWADKLNARDDGCQFRGQAVPVRGEQFGLVACIVLRCWGADDHHHVYSKKARPRLRYDVDNGLRLCRGHHDYAHTAEGKLHLWDWLQSKHPERCGRLWAKARRESRLA